MVFRFRERLAHPFVILIIGFPAFYGVLLLSSWGGRTRRLGTDHVQLEAQPKERGGLPFGEEDEAPFVGLLRIEERERNGTTGTGAADAGDPPPEDEPECPLGEDL